MYQLQRGPVLGDVAGHADEKALLHSRFLAASSPVALLMMAPALYLFSPLTLAFEQVPPLDLALQTGQQPAPNRHPTGTQQAPKQHKKRTKKSQKQTKPTCQLFEFCDKMARPGHLAVTDQPYGREVIGGCSVARNISVRLLAYIGLLLFLASLLTICIPEQGCHAYLCAPSWGRAT